MDKWHRRNEKAVDVLKWTFYNKYKGGAKRPGQGKGGIEMRDRSWAGKGWIFVLWLFVAGIFWGIPASAEELVTISYDGTLDYDSANDVYHLVNQERKAAGLSPLMSNEQIQHEAMIRAAELALYYSHTRPKGTRGLDIISNKKKAYGENIAAGQETPDQVMNQWMNSDGHRKNILNGDYTQIGVGCFYCEGEYFWVQLFNGNTSSGSIKMGRIRVTFEVNVLPSLLDLFTNSSSLSVKEGETARVSVRNRNQGWEWMDIPLRVDSPSFGWACGEAVSLKMNGSSLIIQGEHADNASVWMSLGTDVFVWSVNVEHTPGKLTCTGGQICTFCGEKLMDAPGHNPGKAATCTEDQKCTRCGEILQKRLGHNYTAATCKKKSTCTRCGNVNGGYEEHSWGEWKFYTEATTYAPKKEKRVCSTCGDSQVRTVGSKLVPVTSISLSGKSHSLLAGKKMTLTARVRPLNASSGKVKWTSSNSKYALVTSKGVVLARSAGAGRYVTITAQALDGSGKKATFRIKVVGAVKKITLKAPKRTLKAGQKMTVRSVVSVGKGGSRALRWKSSNKKYASVNSKGQVSAKRAGKGKTVTITALAGDGSGKKASIRIKIL